MRIQLQKFGTMLISRPMGKEAYAAFLPTLRELSDNEPIEIDFAEVDVFTPSWGDEFLRPLLDTYGDRLTLINLDKNPSIMSTVEFLEETNKIAFKRGSRAG